MSGAIHSAHEVCRALKADKINPEKSTTADMDEGSDTSNGGRGLLTDAERASLAGDRSYSDQYQTRSRLKSRIEKVGHDADILAEHAPDLLDDLRAAVDAEVWRVARESGENLSDEQTSADTFDADELEGNPENTIDDNMNDE
jgi:hypothetical protein